MRSLCGYDVLACVFYREEVQSAAGIVTLGDLADRSKVWNV